MGIEIEQFISGVSVPPEIKSDDEPLKPGGDTRLRQIEDREKQSNGERNIQDLPVMRSYIG